MAEARSRTELLVGAFLLLGLGLLGWLIVSYGKLTSGLDKTYQVTVRFSDASGIIEGTEVRLGGAKIGMVAEDPQLEEGVHPAVRVKLALQEDRMIPTNSTFQIQALDFLGSKAIVVKVPEVESGEFFQGGEIIKGGGPTGLERIQSQALDITQTLQVNLEKINDTLGSVQNVTDSLQTTLNLLNEQLLREDNLEAISQGLANFESAMSNFEAASGEVRPLLIETRQSVTKIGELAEGAQSTAEQLNAGLEDASDVLAQLPETIATVEETAQKTGLAMDEASSTMKMLRNRDGLLQSLTNDQVVKADAEIFLRNLRRYGILGYKDASTYEERDPRNRQQGRRR